MARIKIWEPAPAYLFSRRLEEELKEEEDALLWVIVDDNGPKLAMLDQVAWLWRTGTVVLIEGEQWTHMDDGRWVNARGEFATHTGLMEKAFNTDPEYRRIVLWRSC